MGLYDTFAKINSALDGKPQPGQGGTVNKVGYDSRAMDMGPRNAAIAKMKALGLATMPEGGEEELDRQWNEFTAKQSKTAAMLKGAKAK